MKALLVLKDLQPNRPDKATYLANHKKNWVVVVDPAISLSTYTPCPMEVVPPRAPRWWTTVRPRKGTMRSGEDATVDAHAERSTRVHWFGCGVRLPSPQNNKGCG